MIRNGKMDAVHAELSPEVVFDCVAFANTIGGYIHIGYDHREIIGVHDPERIKHELRTTLQKEVSPNDLFDYVKISVDDDNGKAVIKIQVPAISSSVHFVASEGLENGVYIRDGAKTVLATDTQTAQLLDRVYFKWKDTAYLLRHSPWLHADFTVLSQYCENHKTSEAYKKLMENGSFLVCKDGAITNMGRFFSDHCPPQIQIYEETGLSKKRTCYEYSGPYFMQIISALEKLTSYNPFRKDQSFALPYDYPPDAIAALMYHAVRYRDYSLPGTIIFHAADDHIEVSYPGSLVPPFGLEDYMNGGSYPKDPEMSKALSKLGINILQYADFGVIMGIYDTYGIQPKYSITEHVIRVILPNINRSAAVANFPQLSAKVRDVLDLIYLRYCVKRGDVERELQIPQATAVRTLNALVEKKLIEKTGVGRNTLYRNCSNASDTPK